MTEILTRQFGALTFDESAVVQFPAGLPGFPDQRRFVMVEEPSLAPLVFLQSLGRNELCFAATPVHAIDSHYELAMAADDLTLLGLSELKEEDVLCLAILSAPENGPLTANLLAPVVIEKQTRRAVQAVRSDRRYSHQHPLGAAGASCS